MTEPDELYTLRAQFWLGHYGLAIEEAKSIARRPMTPALKAEREEFLARAYIEAGQYDRVTDSHTPALQALTYKAQFDAAMGNPAAQETALDQIKSLVGSHTNEPVVQLIASQVLMAAGQLKEAMGAIHQGSTMEQISMKLHLLLKMDRLDLARDQLQLMRQSDEDAILTQLGAVYVHLATGSTAGSDAMHTLTALSEQYGSSPLLLNLMAAALMQQGDFAAANDKLQEAMREHPADKSALPDTLCNLIVCCVHQHTSPELYVQQMKMEYPWHSFCAGLDRVTGAFEREAIKYKV